MEAKTFASETKVIRSSSIQKVIKLSMSLWYEVKKAFYLISKKTIFLKIMQVPQMQPCSPKIGRKPTPRLVHKDTCCQSPSKPKNFIEINKKKLSSSMAFMSKKQC